MAHDIKDLVNACTLNKAAAGIDAATAVFNTQIAEGANNVIDEGVLIMLRAIKAAHEASDSMDDSHVLASTALYAWCHDNSTSPVLAGILIVNMGEAIKHFQSLGEAYTALECGTSNVISSYWATVLCDLYDEKPDTP